MGVCSGVVKFAIGVVTLNPDKIKEGAKETFSELVAPVLEPVFSLLGIRDQTVHSVEISTIRLLEGTTSYQNSILLSTIIDGGDIGEALQYAAKTSPKITIRDYSRKALANYSDGVPTLRSVGAGIDEFAVREYLGSLGNFIYGIDISFVDIGIPIPTMWVQEYLWRVHDYNITTNEIFIGNSQWFYDSYLYDATNNTYTVYVNRIVNDNTEVILLNDVIPGFDPISAYASAIYVQLNKPDHPEIWFYRINDQTISRFDTNISNIDFDGSFEFIPIIALRENYVSVNVDKDSDRYKETVEVLSHLKVVDIDKIIEEIEGNPQASSIQDAFLIFGTNLYKQDDAHLEYFYQIFKRFALVPGFTKETFEKLTPRAQSGTSFTYTIEEGNFRSALNYNYLHLIPSTTGVIGNVGKVTLEFFILPNTPAAQETCEEDGDHPNSNPICTPPPYNSTRGLVNSYIRIRKQITATTYEQMTVHGLNIANIIKIDGSNVRVKLIPLVDPNDPTKQKERDDFILPMSFEYLNRLSSKHADTLVYEGFHLVIYAHEETHLEYYETNKFLFLVGSLLEVAVIILTLVLLLSGTGEVGLTIGEQLLILVGNILVQAAIQLTIREILSHNLSSFEKFLVAVAAVILTRESGHLFNKDLALAFTDEVLLAVNSIVNVFLIDLDNKNNLLIQETEDFETLKSTKEEELQASEDFLKIDGSIDTAILLNSRVAPILDTWSTPDEFYTRTLTTNVADIVLGQTGNYHSSALDLDNIQANFNRNPNDLNLLSEIT